MQEKRNKRLFILLLVLIPVTVIIFLITAKEKTVQVDKDIFHIEDLTTIDKVVLQSDTKKVTLAFNGTRWKVNDRYDADRNMISVLMATLKEAEPKREINSVLKDSISENLKTSGVQVTLYSGATKEKTFYAGGNASKMQSYFQDTESGKIYVMNIPGYRVYVSGILELPESGFRDKYVFGFNWRNFQSLKAEFPERPSGNFRIAQKDNFFGVEGLLRTDTTKLNSYMDNVLSLTVDQYLDSSSLTDSILTQKPIMIITITDIASRNYVLKLFPEKQGQFPGIMEENEKIIFNPLKIRPLIRPKSFFEAK